MAIKVVFNFSLLQIMLPWIDKLFHFFMSIYLDRFLEIQGIDISILPSYEGLNIYWLGNNKCEIMWGIKGMKKHKGPKQLL